MSQDRKRQNNHVPPSSPSKHKPTHQLSQPPVPTLPVTQAIPSPTGRGLVPHDKEGGGRIDSARTFIRKYQRSYNADRPPANPLRQSAQYQETNHHNKKNHLPNTHDDHFPLEQSLQSESFLHQPDILIGSELPADFHALMDLDKTLKSESRFVYPDGRAFVGGNGGNSGSGNENGGKGIDQRPGSSAPRPQLHYQLQPYEHADVVPVQLSLPSPPRHPLTPPPRKYELPIEEPILAGQYTSQVHPLQTSVSSLGSGPASPAGSAITLASERSKRHTSNNNNQVQVPRNGRKDQGDSDDDDDVEFDIDKAFRRNRRKYALLDKMGVHTADTGETEGNFNIFSGPEELDLLLNGLQSVSSSRPTTAGTGRPVSRPSTCGTLQGESQLVNKRDYGDLLQQEREKYKQKQQFQLQQPRGTGRHHRRHPEPHDPSERQKQQQHKVSQTVSQSDRQHL